MAMCTSGNLSICGTAGTCRSISTAVGTGSGSLSALNVSSGEGPGMTSYYGYSAAKDVNFCQYYKTGTDGSSTTVYSCTCTITSAAMTSSECYCLCSSHNVCVGFSQPGTSFARVCMRCNGALLFNCCITNAQYCGNFTCNLRVDYNDTIQIYNYAYTGSGTASDSVRSQSTMVAIGNCTGGGSFAKGTTCTSVCRYTA